MNIRLKIRWVYWNYLFYWKSKGIYSSKLKQLYTAFLHSIKLSGYKIGIEFDKDLLDVEQNNYITKIINVYSVYDLKFGQEILLIISNSRIPLWSKT